MIATICRLLNPRSKAVQMADRASARLVEARKRLQHDLNQIRRVEKKASAILERILSIAETLSEDVDLSQRRLAQAEKALEALRSEHDVDADVVIPALQSRFREIQATSEAKIAESNYRRAAATPKTVERDI